jgi:hypothetical protein
MAAMSAMAVTHPDPAPLEASPSQTIDTATPPLDPVLGVVSTAKPLLLLSRAGTVELRRARPAVRRRVSSFLPSFRPLSRSASVAHDLQLTKGGSRGNARTSSSIYGTVRQAGRQPPLRRQQSMRVYSIQPRRSVAPHPRRSVVSTLESISMPRPRDNFVPAPSMRSRPSVMLQRDGRMSVFQQADRPFLVHREGGGRGVTFLSRGNRDGSFT